MSRPSGWAGLFWDAFKRSRNCMALLGAERVFVEVIAAFVSLLGTSRAELIGHHSWERVAGGPLMTPAEWRVALGREEFSGVAELKRDDGATVTVQFAGHPETLTGRRYVLAVAVSHGRLRRRAVPATSTESDLTEREREVVELIGEGRTAREIAEELQISHNTVRSHVWNAMTKLGARSRAHLVAKALGEGRLVA